MIYILIIIVLILLFGFYQSFIKKRKKISKNSIIYFNKQILNISRDSSLEQKIINYDKLYHKIILEAGYKGTFGEILKQKPYIIDNVDRIWTLHKLRNKLVHDFENYDKKYLEKNINNYNKEIKLLLNKLK